MYQNSGRGARIIELSTLICFSLRSCSFKTVQSHITYKFNGRWISTFSNRHFQNVRFFWLFYPPYIGMIRATVENGQQQTYRYFYEFFDNILPSSDGIFAKLM
ncbi:hypothetical protein Tcan_09552 [Toxocara canis]|uniref:Uncharacterized protein n=1 Tax=Toxocara canis TaxID=6265 RepID=A0A0B2VG90_TOXCA|nr:hypothetical protein Tcan_09552 [Toxocara canis]